MPHNTLKYCYFLTNISQNLTFSVLFAHLQSTLLALSGLQYAVIAVVFVHAQSTIVGRRSWCERRSYGHYKGDDIHLDTLHCSII